MHGPGPSHAVLRHIEMCEKEPNEILDQVSSGEADRAPVVDDMMEVKADLMSLSNSPH